MKLFNSTVVEQVKTMKPLTTIISNNKPLNKVRGTSLLQILTVCLFSSLLVLPTVAALQSPGLTIPTLPNTGSVTLTCSVSATGV